MTCAPWRIARARAPQGVLALSGGTVAVLPLELRDRHHVVLEGMLGINAHVSYQLLHDLFVVSTGMQPEGHALAVYELRDPIHPGEDMLPVRRGRNHGTPPMGKNLPQQAGVVVEKEGEGTMPTSLRTHAKTPTGLMTIFIPSGRMRAPGRSWCQWVPRGG